MTPEDHKLLELLIHRSILSLGETLRTDQRKWLTAVETVGNQITAAIEREGARFSHELDRQHAAMLAQAVVTYKTLEATKDQLRLEFSKSREHIAAELTTGRNQVSEEFTRTRENLSLKTEADLQIELAEKISHAVATRSKINAFVADITARFEKSVEGIYLNRQLYNLNFKKIFDEYQNKIRTIAQHIYEITEQDFGPATKAALTAPDQICELPIEVDLLRLKLRAESLDECLELLKNARLDDILLSLNKLGHSLENEFRVALPSGSSPDAVHCVYGLHMRAHNDETVLLQSTVTTTGTGSQERVVIQPPADGFKRYHEETARRSINQSIARRSTRPATETELSALRSAATRLVQTGRISADSQGLLSEFLERGLLHYVQ